MKHLVLDGVGTLVQAPDIQMTAPLQPNESQPVQAPAGSRGPKSAPPVPGALRNALLPTAVVVALFARYVLGFGFLPSALLCVPFLVLFFLGPRLANRSARAFDLDAVRFLSKGKQAALPDRYRRAFALRMWGAPAQRHQRRAWALFESRKFSEASLYYQKAIRGYDRDKDVPEPLRLMAAQAAYFAKEDETAVLHYEKLSESGLPDVVEHLAHAHIRLGQKEGLTRADELLGEVSVADSAKRVLVRALLSARSGSVDAARHSLASLKSRDPALAELKKEIKSAVSASKKRSSRNKPKTGKGSQRHP